MSPAVNKYKRAANCYVDIQNNSNLGEESPHRLIQMLMEAFLTKVNSAKGAITHRDFEAKCRYINHALVLIGGLDDALDLDQGGELSANLRKLYQYIRRRLLEASTEMSQEKLDEVASLMRDIKTGWDAIG